MKAIILAAGQGKRLGGRVPKCLATVGGRTLMQHQMDALLAHGIVSVVVVVGFGKRAVIEHLAQSRAQAGLRVTFVENPVWERVNNVYSLWAARAEMDGGFVLLNCDVIFHPEILTRLLDTAHDNAIAVEYKRCGSEEMKVVVAGARVTRLSKDLDPARAVGEYIGLARFSAAGAAVYSEVLDEMVTRDQRHSDYYEEAMNRLVRTTDIYPVDVTGLPVIEIDYPEDLEAARSEVYPRIAAGAPAGF
jgi:L-glutamine-phosphate cytidylyltransferase